MILMQSMLYAKTSLQDWTTLIGCLRSVVGKLNPNKHRVNYCIFITACTLTLTRATDTKKGRQKCRKKERKKEERDGRKKEGRKDKVCSKGALYHVYQSEHHVPLPTS